MGEDPKVTASVYVDAFRIARAIRDGFIVVPDTSTPDTANDLFEALCFVLGSEDLELMTVADLITREH